MQLSKEELALMITAALTLVVVQAGHFTRAQLEGVQELADTEGLSEICKKNGDDGSHRNWQLAP